MPPYSQEADSPRVGCEIAENRRELRDVLHTTTLADLLGKAAERDGDGLALRDQGQTFSWAQAAQEAGRLGTALDEVGVQPGDRVGVHFRKSAEAFLAMHAVVQRGAVAVPLDPSASPAYLAAVAAQTGCNVLTTHSPCLRSALSLEECLRAGGSSLGAIVGVEPPPPGAEPAAGDSLTSDEHGCRFLAPAVLAGLTPASPRRTDPDALAYIITTSGSTGVPKGISHTHRSALAYVAFKQAAYDLVASDRVSDIAPNHFDISTLALWVSPAVGAANVVVPEPHQMLPASLSQLAADERITVWYSVPYLLTQLLDRGQLDDRDLSALRWVLFGGELFPPGVLARLMARWPTTRFSNVYGPAEVNACTVHHLDGPPRGQEPLPIGLPVNDSQVRLVDPADPAGEPGPEPPWGQPGEIWVCAPTMMAGYWQRPDLDRRSIVTTADGRRWYRTGDVGHRDPDGALVFTGRVDHQVKVRGHRIELEAIEAVLEEAPGVANAVAAVARPGSGADVVVAGLAPAAGVDLDLEAVRRFAADRLPAYAVPATIQCLEALPTTGSGKLDRRAIRAGLAAKQTTVDRTAIDRTAIDHTAIDHTTGKKPT
jgi:amino acid adenylation domain-containing protein